MSPDRNTPTSPSARARTRAARWLPASGGRVERGAAGGLEARVAGNGAAPSKRAQGAIEVATGLAPPPLRAPSTSGSAGVCAGLGGVACVRKALVNFPKARADARASARRDARDGADEGTGCRSGRARRRAGHRGGDDVSGVHGSGGRSSGLARGVRDKWFGPTADAHCKRCDVRLICWHAERYGTS